MLEELLEVQSDHKPAWVYGARLYFTRKRYQEALTYYHRGLAPGVATVRDYQQAATAASQLGDHSRAHALLSDAVRQFPAQAIPGLLWYNKACYAFRAKQWEEGMNCLRSAIAAGYRKKEQYAKDVDLDPVRSRPEFQQLLRQLS
jgi:tetratricopeptide (TPR) repeat protein